MKPCVKSTPPSCPLFHEDNATEKNIGAVISKVTFSYMCALLFQFCVICFETWASTQPIFKAIHPHCVFAQSEVQYIQSKQQFINKLLWIYCTSVNTTQQCILNTLILIVHAVSRTHGALNSLLFKSQSVSVVSYVKFLSWPVDGVHLFCLVKFN